VLESGDSLYFRSTQLHPWRNDSDTPTTVVWINVPIIDASGAGVDRRHGTRQRTPHAAYHKVADRLGAGVGDGGRANVWLRQRRSGLRPAHLDPAVSVSRTASARGCGQ
jgi:hypothetical protein